MRLLFIVIFVCLSAKMSFAGPKKPVRWTWTTFSSQSAPLFFDVQSLLRHYATASRYWLFFRVPITYIHVPRQNRRRQPVATPQVAPDHIVYWPNEEAQLNFATQPQLVNFFLQNPPPSRHRVRVNGTTALIGDENSTLREYLLNITRSPFHEQYERNGLTSIIARLLPDLTLEEGRLLAANYADLLILFHQTDVLLGRYPPEAVREHTLNVFREEFARLGLLEPPQRPTRAVVTPTGSGGRFR